MFYDKYSDFVIFGLFIALVTVDAFRNYDPRKTCEILASKQKNHAIVIGYDHLGIRLHKYLQSHKIPYIIVSRHKDELTEVFEEEKPAVLYDELDDEFPTTIQLKRAKYLFLLDDNLVFNLKMIIQAKNMNSNAKLVVRCFEDDFAKIFEKYGATVISASSTTAKIVFEEHLGDPNLKEIHIIGFSHFAERMSTMAMKQGIKSKIISDSFEMIKHYNKLTIAERQLVTVITGNPLDYKTLQDAGVFESLAVIIAIETDDIILLVKELKDMNPKMLIIARTFSDEIEKVLENFGVIPISTSKYALKTQIMPLLQKP